MAAWSGLGGSRGAGCGLDARRLDAARRGADVHDRPPAARRALATGRVGGAARVPERGRGLGARVH
eukprot:2249710-Prymnesium_polylepis.1